MAFSTQKDIIKIAFLNNRLEPTCPIRAAVKLKSYVSTVDFRAWSMSRDAQAHFLADLVACRIYGENIFEGDGSIERQISRYASRSRSVSGISDASSSSDVLSNRAYSSRSGSLKEKDELGLNSITKKDSLLVLARDKLEEINQLILEKQQLKKDLDFTNKKVSNLQEENNRLKSSFSLGIDPFKKKLNELQNEKKITDEDVQTFLEMAKYFGCKEGFNEVLEAENNFLKQLVEKLRAQTNDKALKSAEGDSEQIANLKKLVNELKEETRDLRQKVKAKKENKNIPDVDPQTVDKIIEERNNLREQLKQMVGIEGKIQDLKERANEANRLQDELNDTKRKCVELEKEHIDEGNFGTSENQLDEMEALKDKQAKLCEALKKAYCKLQKMQSIEQELADTQARLEETENVLGCYEHQMHQLMVRKMRVSRALCHLTELYLDLRGLSVSLVQWILNVNPSFGNHICYVSAQIKRLSKHYE